ncbi:hypothetical protein [Streptomyces sp. NPDC008150]|uniref:hypothetical protein n=1 Tax=Streptomyces sp. NPDC008150 TaxID=3364816 RepID=UPI0036E203D7
MLTAAVDVLGPDRVMFGAHSPYRAPTAADDTKSPGLSGVDSRGSFADVGGARAFADSAPPDEQGGAKLGHLNAERILSLRTA